MENNISKILSRYERKVTEFDKDHVHIEYVPRDATENERSPTRRGFLTMILAGIAGIFGFSF